MKRTVDDLQRPEGNSLVENYEEHDVAERAFLNRLPDHIDVEDTGIDKRHDDSGELIYSDAPDIRLWDGDEPICYVDFKAKSSDKWMGNYNLRHHHKYQEQSLPVIVFFYNTSTKDSFCYEVGPDEDVLTSEQNHFLQPFPDYNGRVYVPESERMTTTHFISTL